MLLAALGVACFSLTLPMTKIAVGGLDPMLAVAGRAAAAAALAACALLVGSAPRLARSALPRIVVVVAGVVVGFPLLTTYAIRAVPAGHGAIVIGLLPLATAGFAVVRTGDRPSGRYWVCSIVGLAAVVAYALNEGGGSLQPADLLLVAAVIAAALGYTEGALLARDIPGWQVVSWALVLAAPLTITMTAVLLAAHWPPEATTTEWLAFAYTAAVSMFLGFFAWYAGLARAGIARGGQLQLAQPALSVLWAWPLLGEPVTGIAALTAAIVIAAVAAGRRAPIRHGQRVEAPECRSWRPRKPST